MTSSIEQLAITDQTVRREVYSTGQYLGRQMREAMNDAPAAAQHRVAIQIAGMFGVRDMPASLVQGLWHGYGDETPLSMIKEGQR